MRALAILVGLAIAGLGAWAFVLPEVLNDIAHRFATPAGVWLAAAIRIAVGVLLLSIAGRSRSPVGLLVIGALAFFGGLVTPFIGVERARGYVEWWSYRDANVMRFWALVAIVLGLFVAWAATPRMLRRRPI